MLRILLFQERRNSEFGTAARLKPNIGGGQVDEYWNNLVLGMIGATIEPANMITGLVGTASPLKSLSKYSPLRSLVLSEQQGSPAPLFPASAPRHSML